MFRLVSSDEKNILDITREMMIRKTCAHQRVVYHFNNLISYSGAMA